MIVSAELGPDEMLLWSGHPSRKRVLLLCLLCGLVGLPWSGFSLLWVIITAIGALAAHGGWSLGFLIALLFGLLFLAGGIGILVGAWRLYTGMMQMNYALTDNRVLLIRAGEKRSVQAYT